MKCPRCVQRIHANAARCPHCAFSLEEFDAAFGSEEVELSRLMMDASVLKLKELKKLQRWLDDFERMFPQLFLAVYFGAFTPEVRVREYSFWLLNRGAFHDVDVTRPNEGGILLMIDVAEKAATMTFGYQLDGVIRGEETFDILATAHSQLLQEQYLHACKIVIRRLTKLLQTRSAQALRAGQPEPSSTLGLRGIRSGKRATPSKKRGGQGA